MSKKIKNYSIRDARRDDSRRIHEVRNYPDIRAVSRNTEEVSFVSHDNWFEAKYFSGKKNYCKVIINSEDEVVGYCRLDHDDLNNKNVISIALDPEFHDKGMGRNLLNAMIASYGNSLDIFAEIEKTNERSVHLFVTSDFEKIASDEEHNFYKRTKR